MTTTWSLTFLDKLVAEGRTAFTAAEARDLLGLSAQATSNVLTRLTKAGLLERVAGGRYVIRPIGALGTNAGWDDLGSAVGAVFFGHPHRVGFLTALDHHGLLVRPVRDVQVASSYRPRLKTVSGRPLRLVAESPGTVLEGTEPLGPSRVSNVERALLDVASKPRIVGGASPLAEALSSVQHVSGISALAGRLKAEVALRRVGSVATALSFSVAADIPPIPWKSVIELEPGAKRGHGWIDKRWGVGWSYPVGELEAVVST